MFVQSYFEPYSFLNYQFWVSFFRAILRYIFRYILRMILTTIFGILKLILISVNDYKIDVEVLGYSMPGSLT